jgi:hypothetical protein
MLDTLDVVTASIDFMVTAVWTDVVDGSNPRVVFEKHVHSVANEFTNIIDIVVHACVM